LLTWTRIFNPPLGFDQRYLAIGVVEFENGVKAMGHTNVGETFDLRDGMRLQLE
jgi:uncharacterized OB-fold protein